jgi:hypothetical protein
MAGGAIVLFLLVDTFPGFAQNLFEKRQAVTGRFFLRKFQVNPGTESINRKEGKIKI